MEITFHCEKCKEMPQFCTAEPAAQPGRTLGFYLISKLPLPPSQALLKRSQVWLCV